MWEFVNYVDKTKSDTEKFKHSDTKEMWEKGVERDKTTKNKEPNSLPDAVNAFEVRKKLFH